MKLSMDEIMMMNAVQQVAGVMPKDCITEDGLISFLIPEKLMGKAIGKKAVNIKDLEKNFKRRVEFVPYFEKAEDIFANALEVNYLSSKVNSVKVSINLNSAAKTKVFKNSSRLRRVKEFIQRNFGLELVVN